MTNETNDMPDVIYAWPKSDKWFTSMVRSPWCRKYIRADLVAAPVVSSEDAKRALYEINSIIFSDGAGAVCAWYNRNQETIRVLLAAAAKESE